MLLNFGNGFVVVGAVVDDGVVGVSFLEVNEGAMDLMKMRMQQNLESSFRDEGVI